MKNILFVVDERKMGGVSIVLEDILNNIDLTNKKIDLLVLHNNGDRFEELKKQIKIIYGTDFFNVIDIPMNELKQDKKYLSILKKVYISLLIKTNLIKYKIKKERKRILNKRYDAEIAFKYGFATLFTYYGDSNKKINWVHCDCKLNDPAINYRNIFKQILPKFNYNILLSKMTAKNFNDIYNCDNIKIINNIISKEKIYKKTKNIVYKKDKILNLISIGRLCEQKDYNKLIEAFKKLKDDNLLENIKLNIIGDGELKNNLQDKINVYNLNDNIKLLGKIDNPYPLLKQSDLYVMSSRDEAYPLVLIEAFMCNVPVVTVDIASAKEMVDCKYGIITPNSIDGLYGALKKIIIDREIIYKLRNNLNSYVYPNDKILEEIEEVLK